MSTSTSPTTAKNEPLNLEPTPPQTPSPHQTFTLPATPSSTSSDDSTEQRKAITNLVLNSFKRQKQTQSTSFMHRSLTLTFESSLPPSRQKRRIAFAKSPRNYELEVTNSDIAEECMTFSMSDRRILQVLQSEEVFAEVDEPLPELSDSEIEAIYERFMDGEEAYPWEEMNGLIKKGYQVGGIDRRAKLAWDCLYEVRVGLKGDEEMMRDMVCDLVLWNIAVDRRWGLEKAKVVVKGLGLEVFTLIWGDFVYKIRVGEVVDRC